jgi:hypothetical protein
MAAVLPVPQAPLRATGAAAGRAAGTGVAGALLGALLAALEAAGAGAGAGGGVTMTGAWGAACFFSTGLAAATLAAVGAAAGCVCGLGLAFTVVAGAATLPALAGVGVKGCACALGTKGCAATLLGVNALALLFMPLVFMPLVLFMLLTALGPGAPPCVTTGAAMEEGVHDDAAGLKEKDLAVADSLEVEDMLAVFCWTDGSLPMDHCSITVLVDY